MQTEDWERGRGMFSEGRSSEELFPVHLPQLQKMKKSHSHPIGKEKVER